MQIVITKRDSSGAPYSAQSACGRYTWFCGQDDYLQDVQAGRSIYQMAYLKTHGFGSDSLPEDVKADTRAFWAALLVAQHQAADAAQESASAAHVAELERLRADAPAAAERARRAREFDKVHNEGGEGYNPFRAA